MDLGVRRTQKSNNTIVFVSAMRGDDGTFVCMPFDISSVQRLEGRGQAQISPR